MDDEDGEDDENDVLFMMSTQMNPFCGFRMLLHCPPEKGVFGLLAFAQITSNGCLK